MNDKKALVAFSGGLDTSFCVPFVKEKYGVTDVITCTINTGGFTQKELAEIEARSKELGAEKHIAINAEEELYQGILKYLIFGNAGRDGYPLCVSSERMIQGVKAIEQCKKEGAKYFVHGSTGAGNDQYRFDLAARVLGDGEIEVVTPIRDFGFKREEEVQYLRDKNFTVNEKSTKYSYNIGLWGVHIGGTETHTSTGLIPENEWYSKPEVDLKPQSLKINFIEGEPLGITVEGGETAKSAAQVIKLCAKYGNRFGVGRHYHIGTSIPGKKGRIAYESPAADIIYEAHRTLEKITLTQNQISFKRGIADEYAKLIHEAKFFDPIVEDLKAYLISSQKRVTGEVTLKLGLGRIFDCVAESPFNLLSAKGAVYGESSSAYSGDDARGSCKIYGFEQGVWWDKR